MHEIYQHKLIILQSYGASFKVKLVIKTMAFKALPMIDSFSTAYFFIEFKYVCSLINGRSSVLRMYLTFKDILRESQSVSHCEVLLLPHFGRIHFLIRHNVELNIDLYGPSVFGAVISDFILKNIEEVG